jgi:3-hydroxy-3-methylglutaryl CoA synthase
MVGIVSYGAYIPRLRLSRARGGHAEGRSPAGLKSLNGYVAISSLSLRAMDQKKNTTMGWSLSLWERRRAPP